jgi:signal transduction histidine kinase
MSQFAQAHAAIPADKPGETASENTAAVVRHIAHELRQPLSSIESIAYYLGIVLPPAQTKARAQVAKLQDLIAQINWILADAVRFLQPATMQTDLLDLEEITGAAVAEWAQTHGVAVRIELAGGVPLVRVDPEQTRHLVQSLLFFGRQVARSGQAMTVRTLAEGGEVRLQVSAPVGDNELSDVESLFEPYQPHFPAGSGLALASVRRIAEAHGARAAVEISPGQACFVVAFPAAS